MQSNLVKWIKFLAFGVLLSGGLNLLVSGLFGFDIVGLVFGGVASVGARIVFSLMGLSAVALLTIVLIKAFANTTPQKQVTNKKEA